VAKAANHWLMSGGVAQNGGSYTTQPVATAPTITQHNSSSTTDVGGVKIEQHITISDQLDLDELKRKLGKELADDILDQILAAMKKTEYR
jgi:hypothetical protein